jgi:hypothetical protein
MIAVTTGEIGNPEVRALQAVNGTKHIPLHPVDRVASGAALQLAGNEADCMRTAWFGPRGTNQGLV